MSVSKTLTKRAHVILPVDVVADIDKLVGKRGRSLTWNCRHIANAELNRHVVERYGFDLPGLCTPEELMGEAQ